ncbi:Ig domain-containing protein [Geotalea toluenoxydans]|uniref:Ig domain-containing protein n=1 Tax=Geotalea toluenoxydans TaxID=421624 RepID=UPI0006D18E7D|nr:Ig domain-containing protein [Geotalea toluenoxydans]
MTKFVAVCVAWILIATAGVCPADETLPETAGCPPLSLAPLALPPGVETNPYSYRISTYGGQQPIKIFFTSGAFPPGLVMSPTGEITGVPKISGTFEFDLVAEDSCPTGAQRVSRSLKLVIVSGKDQQAQASVIRHQRLKLKVTAIPAATTLAGVKRPSRW